MLHMPCALRPSCADVLYVITCFTCLLAFDSSVPSFLMSLMCPHFLCALRAFIFYVLFVLPLFYVPCGFIFFILLHLPYITLIPSGTFGFLNEKDNPILSVSQLGDFSNDQMKFISFAQGIRTMSLQCCYNIFDVETALQQPYYSQLWHADCHYADFNWSLRQGIILVKVLRTRLYSSSFSRWFREVFRSGWHVIYNNILHVKYTPLSNNFLKYIAKKSPNQLFNKNVCVLGCSITYKKGRQGKRHERHVRNWKHLKKWKHVRHVKEWRHVRHINKWGGVNKESA